MRPAQHLVFLGAISTFNEKVVAFWPKIPARSKKNNIVCVKTFSKGINVKGVHANDSHRKVKARHPLRRRERERQTGCNFCLQPRGGS